MHSSYTVMYMIVLILCYNTALIQNVTEPLSSYCLSIFVFMRFVIRACSWVAIINLSVSHLKFASVNLCQPASVPTFVVCCRNWLCSFISFSLFVLLFNILSLPFPHWSGHFFNYLWLLIVFLFFFYSEQFIVPDQLLTLLKVSSNFRKHIFISW